MNAHPVETEATAPPATTRRRSAPDRTGTAVRPARRKSGKAVGQKWARRLHTWLSTTSLLIVLFFSVSGVTLNHPTWLGASTPTSHTVTGNLPASTIRNGSPDPLAISEYLRSDQGVTGQVTAHTETAAGGTIEYQGPGSVASVDYTTSTTAFTLRTTSYSLVAVMNDLHKGRNTGSSFHWLIDASGVLLTLVALTGLALQLYIRRHRRVGLTLIGIGAAVTVALMVLNR